MNVDKIRFHHQLKETFHIEIDRKKGPDIYTYIAYDPKSGLTKIGRSTHHVDRIRSLSARFRTTLKLIRVIEGDFERLLHDRFSKYRSSYEWFYLNKKQLKNLENEAFTRQNNTCLNK